MSKARDGVSEAPPQPKGDASDGKTTPIDGASRDSRVEQLSSELKQLKLQRKIDKLKKKLKDPKSQKLASSSHQMKRPMLHPKKKLREKKEEREIKKSYNTTSFNYDNLPPSSIFTSVPVGKAPPPFRWDELYQIEILNEDASNLAQSEHLDYCGYMS
jgi:hypothetical protein